MSRVPWVSPGAPSRLSAAVLIVGLLLAGCVPRSSDTSGETGVTSAASLLSAAPKEALVRLRGHLVLGHEVRVFRPCGEERELWVIPTSELLETHRGSSLGPYEPVVVELIGELGPPPDTGFGADSDGQLRVMEVVSWQAQGGPGEPCESE